MVEKRDVSTQPFFTFGRHPSSHVTLEHPSCSRLHAVLQVLCHFLLIVRCVVELVSAVVQGRGDERGVSVGCGVRARGRRGTHISVNNFGNHCVLGPPMELISTSGS